MPPICYNGDMIKCICAPTQDDALLALARCAEENEARGERTLVFCEDALTLLAERAVLRARKATFLTEVTTFARYLSGAGRAISKQGSVAAVSAILSESASLACFSANAAEAVYETIAQLAASRVDVAMLRAGAEKSEGVLRAKLFDLAHVYEQYAAFLRERGLLDESGYLALLPERLRAGGLQTVHVILFGFMSFTVQAAEGIRAAAQCAKSVTGIFPAGDSAFYTNESVHVFCEACGGAGEVQTVCVGSTLAGDAEHLRRHLFSPEAHLLAPRRAQAVHLFRAQDEAEEARQVCALIKKYTAEGMRYRDIAVLVPSQEALSPLEKAFEAFRIPYFADVRRPFSRHPFCAYTAAVLRAVADGGLPASVDAVAANVCFGESDAYRNHLLRYGGWRGAYRKEIAAEDGEDAAALCACRERMIAALGCFPRSGTVHAFTEGVRALRALCRADEVCGELAAHFAGAERDFLALDALDGLLAEADTVAGGKQMTAREFAALFTSSAEALKKAMIPVFADAVFAGDAASARFARVKVLFVTGATDALPAAGEDTALITDKEIGRLGARGVDIRPAISVVNARARESLALNVCAFSEALYVSRPLMRKGEEAPAGELFSSCARLFESAPVPELFPYECSERTPALMYLLRQRAAFEEGKTHDERPFSSVWAALSSRGEALSVITENGEKAPVPAAAERFAGEISPTLLESYFACPYAGFMKNVLRLTEREERAVPARAAGDFVHAVLDRAALQFNTLPDEGACRALAEQIGRELLANRRYAALGDTDAGRYAGGRLLEESTQAVLAAFRALRHSAFRVRGGEVAVRLPELGLRGKADRVDAAEGYVRVIDYKTGRFDPSPAAYYTGRSLQLELYLLAAAQGERPAGAFYFPAEDRFLSEDDARFRMQGFYDRDAASLFDPEAGSKSAYFDGAASRGLDAAEFSDFLRYAALVAQRAREELMAGNVTPSPYEGSCAYCAFKGACGFAGAERRERGVKCADIARIAARARGEGGQ